MVTLGFSQDFRKNFFSNIQHNNQHILFFGIALILILWLLFPPFFPSNSGVIPLLSLVLIHPKPSSLMMTTRT